jgi:hypothetical protein
MMQIPRSAREIFIWPTSYQIILILALANIAVGVHFACASSFSAKSDRAESGLLGPVQTVETKEPPLLTTDRYDPTGRLIETLIDVADAKKLQDGPIKRVYVYDTKGNRMSMTQITLEGTFEKAKQYFYDLDAKRVAEFSYRSDYSVESAIYFLYDAKGNLIGRVWDTGQGMVNVSYFEGGKIIKSFQYYRGDILSMLVCSFDSKGNTTESRSYSKDGTLQQKSTFKYDEKGNQIEEAVYERDGSLFKRRIITYDYDSIGNWTKKTTQEIDNDELQNKSKTVVIERKITYY